MDPKTNIPSTPSDPIEPMAAVKPSTKPVEATIDLHPEDTQPPTPAPLPPRPTPSPVSPITPIPAPVSPAPQVFTPNQAALPPQPAASGPVFQPLPPSNTPPTPPQPQVVGYSPPMPTASLQSPAQAGPVVVSGGFEPTAPMGPVVGNVYSAPQPTVGSSPLPSPTTASSRFGFKKLLIALAAIFVITGGSAAAYVGIIAPNQPANVLKAAMINTLKQPQSSFTGNINYQSTGSQAGIPPFQISLDGSKNATTKASDTTIGVAIDGVDVNLEARIVDQNLYLKFGDLSSLAAIIGKADTSLASPATTISNDVSNQWVEVDNSLLQQAGLACFLNSSFSFSPADLNLLSSDYSKNGFLEIQKTSSSTVSGQAAEEFAVNLNDDKAAGFISGLGNLSTIKSLETCKGASSLGSSLAHVKGDNKQTPMTIWVNKATKEISQISMTVKNPSLPSEQISIVLTYNYNPVSITAPANSESVLQLYTQLQPTLQSALSGSGQSLNSLLSGFNSGFSSSI